jgi:transcriptional antiterminator
MPVSAFCERLDLLVRSGQVVPEARKLTEGFVERVEHEFSLTLTDDNAALLVTHLAMSATRLANGEAAGPAPDSLARELAAYPREARFVREALAAATARTGQEFPEAELLYMTAHLCALTRPAPA